MYSKISKTDVTCSKTDMQPVFFQLQTAIKSKNTNLDWRQKNEAFTTLLAKD